MRGEPPAFVVLLFISAVVSFAVAIDAVRRRPARGVLPFAAMALGGGWYALCYALQLASMTLPEKLFWARLQYIGVVAIPAGLLCSAQSYTHRKTWLRRQSQILLAVEPTIILALLWTNDAHHWVWTAAWLQPYSGSFSVLRLGYGPWFWIHAAYSCGLILWAMAVLGRACVHSSYLRRRRAAILLVSAAMPLLGYTLVLTDRNPMAPLDPTAFSAALAILLAAWGLRRYGVFDLVPIARDTVVEQIDEGMVVVNAEGRIVDVNNVVLSLLGRKPAQVIGQPASVLLPFYDELHRRHHDEADVHEEIVWAADRRRCFDLHRSALHDRRGRLGGHLFVLHDITVRREAEGEAQQRNQELTTLYDTALEVASQLDLSRLLQAITERAMQLLQASSADLSLYRPESDDLKATALSGIARELTGTVLKRGEGLSGRMLETGAPLAVEDYRTWPGRAAAFDGLPFGPMVGAPLKWGGQVLGTIDVAREAGPAFTEGEVRLLSLFANQAAVAIANARLYADVQRELGERRLAEEQVGRRSQELSTLYDTVLEVASRLDLAQLLPTIVERAALLLHATGSGMYLYQPTSDTLEHVVAYGRSEEFIGHTLRRGEGVSGRVLDSGEPMTVDDYHHWPSRSPVFESQDVGAVLSVPVKWGERVLGVIDLQRDAGAAFSAEDIRLLTLFANQAAIALANAQLYQAARRELAERKSTEARLQQAQRMEAVGLLAGGVAHEFNNLLTIIEGNVELVMADLDGNQAACGALATVIKTTQRAASLTKQLLAFSRRQVLQPRKLDLNALLSDLANMLRPALRPNVQLSLDLAPGVKPVLADGGAIEQVLMNLALNARDAMPESGELRIATAAATLDEEFCRTRANVKPGEYVRLTVSDTGTGMDDATQRHLFEPFFTTKEVGKGTGLGLSVVYGIIRQHEGLIEVQSKVGQGTRFDVYLPVFAGQ
jgi:two-component system cell cycle sensor histidine kinase/response regulator CckA